MIEPIVFIASGDMYVVIPDSSHTKESWDTAKKDMGRKMQEARDKEVNYRTDGSIIRDDGLGLKLLRENGHIWKCTVIKAIKYPYWELADWS